METRRSFLKKASILGGSAGLAYVLPESIARALAIHPDPGTSFLDAEHIVILMQENRSFDHTYGTLQGVRGFNDPRAITLPNQNPVWLQTDEKGRCFAPFRFDIHGTRITWMDSLPHGWADQVDARNDGKYDRWLEVKKSGDKAYRDMPLTLGYYTRADIPFYYSLADAFTVCDQHFCSSLTGTTPNRLYFWTGTIREEQTASAPARVWNGDADYETMVSWKTFPERLEEAGIPWKVYQNEISAGVGFSDEEDPWLANFGDNPLEYFTQYHVRLTPEYIAHLPGAIRRTQDQLAETLGKLNTAAVGSPEAEALNRDAAWLRKRLATLQKEKEECTPEKFEALPAFEKNIHRRAFDNNRADPDYHRLTTLKYNQGGQSREVPVPAGDIFYQFRKDVNEGKLPAVSWLVAPQNFSDHPSSAWYGAWYISEALDILTHNPEVWKKTIFILTYDENDGYFDHVPPFVAPHPGKPETGAVSAGMDTSLEYVADGQQQRDPDHARISPIGLGYRVPLVIASPWSRGGWVNSQVFDHTSTLQFLEKFLSHKTGKTIREPQISEWRRTVCGDLTSVFRPYRGETIETPQPLNRDAFIETIHKARFLQPPANFRKLKKEEIAAIRANPLGSPLLPRQEKGIRSSCILPYELSVLESWKPNGELELQFQCDNRVFGTKASGAPFRVYVKRPYQGQSGISRDFAVRAGDRVSSSWLMNGFRDGMYHLEVHGPNGFYREYRGQHKGAMLDIQCEAVVSAGKPAAFSGELNLQVDYRGKDPLEVVWNDESYGAAKKTFALKTGAAKKTLLLPLNLKDSYYWYDFTVTMRGDRFFRRRYAGRLEAGEAGKTDPLMGR